MAGTALFVVGIASLAAAMALLYALYPAEQVAVGSDAPAAEPERTAADSERPAGGLSGTVTVGQLVSLSGDAAQDGRNVAAAVEFAVSEFNARPGAGWTMELATEDAATDPQTAVQKAAKLRGAGIGIVIGPITSANLGAVLDDPGSDGMLLVSCCSSAPSLAAEDGAFRMTPDDSREALALSALIAGQGAQAVVPVWRGDLWGDGFKEPTVAALEEAGVRSEPGFRYDPADHRFEQLVPALAEALASAGPGAAVAVFGFDEVDELVDLAAGHGGLAGYRWFGTGVNTDGPLLDDPARRDFLSAAKFATVGVKADQNPAQQRLQRHLAESGAAQAHVFLSGAYDSVWLVGLAMEAAQSSDPAAVRAALPLAAASYEGALGGIAFNAAGDLDSRDYEYWTVGPDGATSLGWYDGLAGSAVMDGGPAAGQVSVSDSVTVTINRNPDGP